MKPLLFLDVDGVVNACDPTLPLQPGTETIKRKGYLIVLQPWLRGCLLRLHEYFEVVWCTTWREEAEPCFAEVLGLPGKRDYVKWGNLKLPALVAYAGDRPWAFVDDDAKWELSQLHPAFDMMPDSLIVTPDVKVGLTEEQTEQLLRFAEAYS